MIEVLLCVFLMIRILTVFSVSVGHLDIFFGQISIKVLCSLFNEVVFVFVLLLSLMSSLYILKPLLDDLQVFSLII